jgi:hypothetical protein
VIGALMWLTHQKGLERKSSPECSHSHWPWDFFLCPQYSAGCVVANGEQKLPESASFMIVLGCENPEITYCIGSNTVYCQIRIACGL